MVEQLLGELSRVLIHSAAVVMQTPLLARHLLLTYMITFPFSYTLRQLDSAFQI